MAPSSSLKIPTMDAAAGPSRQQYPAGSSRPVSVNVQSSASAAAPSSAARKQRASHSVVSSSAQNHQSSSSSSHHLNGGHAQDDGQPPYTDVYSHPAAVAYAAAHPRRTIPKFGPYLLLQTLGEGEFGKVKLGLHSQWGEEVAVKLIRRGNVDTTVRMSKVEREIEVLRTLKHPNIVRLYDVIETDKYIGIIIEYASGGELFDHILAHRYLRERDAAKLFSQLISGVWYIHQKKIVHRDLKLENLLLDRHRNVIITDFGFANRFEHRSDDLMQTSCGSPCYAAPELVISEGLYVGSAVDIWSCGVILYAMLAGYLPFDDDPANPDGDNINLLYKYIVNTPLSFPDYVSQEARGLLSLMLVPDPAYRASLDQVMAHPWLAVYNSTPTDPTLPVPRAFGRTVEELERAAMEQHHQKRLAYQRQMKAAAVASGSGSPDRIGRSHSHRPTGYETGSTSASASKPSRSHSIQPGLVYETSVDQGAGYSGPSSPPTSAPVPGSGGRYEGMDSEDPFAAPSGVVSPEVTSKPGGRKGAARPHTVQVEYDGPRDRSSRKEKGKEPQDDGPRERDRERKQRERSTSRGHTQMQPSSFNGQTSEKRRPSQSSGAKPLPPSPPAPAPVTPRRERTGSKAVPVQNSEPERPNITVASPPDTPLAFASPEGGADDQDEESSSRGSGKRRRGVSTVGGLAKIFSNDHTVNGVSASNASNTSGSLLTPAPSEKEKDNVSHVAATDKKSRRSSLTVIINRTIKSRKGKIAATPVSAVDDAQNEKSAVSTPQVSAANVPVPATQEFSEVTSRPTNDVYDAPGPDRDSGMPASTSKARKVMHWFRSKSKGRDPVEEEEEEKPVAPDNVRKNESRNRSSNAVNQTLSSPRAASVQVTLTAPSRTPSGHQAPIHSQRTPSSATDASLTTPSLVTRIRNSVTVGGGGGGSGSHSKNVAGALRIHHGAVDQDMVTTQPPPEVIKHMKEVLIGMGIEVQVESEYKYRCIRAKRKKVPGVPGVIANVGASPSGGGLAAVSVMGSAASNGVDRRGLPVPSHASFSGGMLRGLLMRRQSSHVSQSGNMSVSFEEEPSVMVLEPGAILDPVYGDPTEDVGDEVRFSVELTRMDRLNDTYSLDIRRLKGNLRSYKFLYDTIRQRADLQR
ncbi:CAMK/CAMKL/Kin4 protein kinase [Desarmillaria tabescens]|uniref:CAMK/CAMKL/Kin4 protein kinase n=1 Tax=Armillaria tabescens TaxID=1929756 RepID=A0AA39NCE0_ARMTA|nr:CAMK/CAMKL/Kin4 protein kinase [Desarmillaria tabescens]KAK0463068.1 CAMK/CAMKL/Kin4 protein kinase [Desarmillaria tabescens]